jgi:hypothetical protein
MHELIRYHVTVEVGAGAEPRFEMREYRRLRDGDIFEWQGRSYRVLSASFDPARPHLAAVKAVRANGYRA